MGLIRMRLTDKAYERYLQDVIYNRWLTDSTYGIGDRVRKIITERGGRKKVERSADEKYFWRGI